MARNTFFAPWKVLLGIVVCSFFLIDAHCNQALAAVELPIGFSDGGGNGQSQILEVSKKIKTAITYTGMILALLGMLGSGIAMLPFIGRFDQGKDAMKISVWVFVGFALTEVLVSWFISLFQ